MSPSAFDSFAPSGRRISGWWAKVAGVSRPSRRASRIWAGVAASRSRPRIDEVDVLAKVVDDDREPVGPVPVAVADRQVAVRPRPRPRTARRCASIQRSEPPPSATRRTGPSSPRSPAVARAARSVPQAAVLVRPTPRTSTASSRSRRRGPRRAAARAAASVRRVVVATGGRGPSSATNPSQSRSSSSAASYSGRLRAAVVVLDAQQDPPVGRARDAPDPDRVRHVTEVQESGRRRCEAGPRPARERGDVSRRRPLRHPGRGSPARGPDRAPRAHAWRPSAGGRAPAGRPAPSGPWLAIVTRSSTSRSRSASRIARRPAARLARPASRASSARSLSSATRRRSRASIRLRSRRSSTVSRFRGGSELIRHRVTEPPGDRFEGEVIAARPLADDRLERDVVEVVDLPERLALGRVGQVDLDERPLDGEQGVAQRDARVGQAAGVDDGHVEVALVEPVDERRPRGWTGRSRRRGRAPPPVPRSRHGSRSSVS